MIDPIINCLSNEQYHHGEEERQYLSSSILKKYLISPKFYKHYIDNPTEEKSDALRFGSMFHDLMSCYAEHSDNHSEAVEQWQRNIAVFEPPVNEKTGQPYGCSTKAYIGAYEAFIQVNNCKLIASNEEFTLVQTMARSLMFDSGATSEQVRKLLKWGKPEVSFFYETEDGIKLKVRPDLLTRKKIIDWKTTTSYDFTEEAINRTILKYGYHISAAMYQYVVHEITGKWLDFILVLASKVAPHDCVMVDMCNYGYRYYPESDIVAIGPGAMEFKRILDLHIKCTKENQWPGAEQAIPENNGVRIMEIQPPRYYQYKFIEEI